ncbi:Multidrug transporter MdtC [Delftia tsuruhatensis]|uniref:efflux RND transporter permease subunit n=1 Tax=Delftia tsuruhatensis TaxID=180282 RepID=UPI001E7B2551|nr:efflux RND transporter permease subunit [Delftia tsuruhatensis]CAB5716909.1 Multidrug transporter MdtC [Delftia tsuruhatensis]CAC9683930.1 Multidrug transporter MdtC [Delftia tsuruhatensis]
MWFTRVSLANPVLATMLMLALVVLGVFSYQRLKVDQFPNVDFPVVVVTVDYPGASPEIVESEVTRKIEEGVNSIAGINALTSRSYESTSVVIIEFQLHVDGRRAAEDVREKVASVRPSLRDEVKEPRVLRFDPANSPIWSVAVLPQAAEGTQAPDAVALTSWADQVLKKRLENVRGVGAVNLVGATPREINIYLLPEALEAYAISPEQIVAAVRSENQDLPLGAIRSREQERVVQIDARMKRPQDFERIIVAQRAGAPVRLGQLARVQDGAGDLETVALYNSSRTLLLSVQKAQDENTIEVVDGLNATLRDLAAELPPGVRLEPIADSARPIRVAVNNVRQTLIEGAALTVLIVFLFLNSWRSTVITGLTLPIALIGTFLFMYWFGFSINMITLMALSLCVGLLIDDAIVVRENIVRHVQMGKDAHAAALDGTQEIGLAVLATTLSIVAVFLPIGFMGGIIGKFFHEFGITIVAAVMISMFVSFTLDPMLSSVWHDPTIHAHGEQRGHSLYDRTLGRVTAWFERATDALSDFYQDVLAWALRHKIMTLVAALSIFVASVALVPLLGTEFVPKADFSETTVSFNTPVGSSIEATEAKARQVDAIIRALPEVRYTLATINTGTAQGKMYASIYVRLLDRHLRQRSGDELSGVLREQLLSVPGITVTHVGQREPVGGQKQVEFSLQGPDLGELERLNRVVMERLRGIPGLVDLDSSLKPDKPVIDIAVRRDAAADLGLSVGSMAAALRTWVAGQTVGNWRASDDQTYDVKVRLAPESRSTPQDLERLPFALPSSDGGTRIVRLNQVATIVPGTGPSQINRRDMTREIGFSANVYLRSSGEVSADIRKALADIALPPGYRTQFSGATKSMNESFGYAVSALALAIIFIYMILASQFKSFLQPLALMTSLPLTLIGVVLALMMFGSALSMFSIIGVVMLMGLVTKNAILLVDFAIRARGPHSDPDTGEMRAGLPREQALLLAARVRLRPILMTTLAMIFGMVPLAFALSEGSEQRAPMGQSVIGGVVTSSLLTLVVVPVVYCYLDDLSLWLRRLWNGGQGAVAASAPTLPRDS